MALLRMPLSFRLTPKQASGRVGPIWLMPQIAVVLLLIVGIGLMLATAQGFPIWLLFFALTLAIPHLVLLFVSLSGRDREPSPEEIYEASSTVQTGWD
jgi:uncharacterized membrane protein SirB2